MIYLVTNEQRLFDSELYKIISVEESLRLLEPLKEVGWDTETEGLDPWTKRLKILQFGCYEFQVVIDCFTVNPLLYKEYLESDRTFLGWNVKFDLKFMFRLGIWPKNVYDGMLAEKLMWLGYPAGMHSMSLAAAGENYLGIKLDKSVRGKVIWAGLQDDVILYSADDVKYLPKVKELQEEKLKEKGLLVAMAYENAFVVPLAYMEYCGIKLDEAKWKEKMRKDRERLDAAKENLDNWLRENMPKSKYIEKAQQGDLFTGFSPKPRVTLNWNSSAQLIPIFKELGIDTTAKGGDAKDTLDAKNLKPQKDKCSLIPIYLDYKEAVKVTSTYGENFLKQINPVSKRIHTSYSQMGADTTRITSGGRDKGAGVDYVNLLNLPSDAETRACFVAEEGNKWISIDYSGQESFIMASIANDKAMIYELTEGSGDLHSLTAKMVFKEIPRDFPVEQIKEKYHHLRQVAKGYEFAFNYAGNDATIMRNFGLSAAEAREIYNNYMNGFNGLKRYQEFRKKDWFDKGYILLNAKTGHKAYIYDYDELINISRKMEDPEFKSYYYSMKKDAPSCDTVQSVKRLNKRKSASDRQSVNYPIQATGSMCLRVSMINFFKYIRENDLFDKVKICVAPYDEINCEAPAEIAYEVARVLHKCMVDAGAYFCTRCKLDADISYINGNELPTYWVH